MFSYTPAPTSDSSHPVPSVEGETQDKAKKESVPLEELFNYGRIKQDASLTNKLLFLLYLPLGVVVFATRVVLFVLLLLAIIILPRRIGDPVTRPMLRVVCGLVVRHNNKDQKKPLLHEPHIVAGNHVADFDTFAMWVVLPKFHTITGAHLKAVPIIGSAYSKLNAIFVTPTPEGRAKVKEEIHKTLKADPAPILIFPEGGLTNGTRGTMMYQKFIFSLDCSIIPAAIALKDPWPITHDYLGSSFPKNLFWFLFVPFHIFEVTLLPAERRNDGEVPEEFAARVQKITSEYLNIKATTNTYAQKKELWKQISSGKKKTM